MTDANTIPSQYRAYIAALVQRGVLVNYPNVSTLNLTQVISRGEACGLVYQALASLGLVEGISSSYLVD
ncbi:MAG: S-layer homology domain-containing protein [Leptolyngbya sp. RL_3_1]|nr:S-layer homology domain-containing protein [Leptolyngbya sp. RL_3_1]